MSKSNSLDILHELEEKSQLLRTELEISKPGEIIFQAWKNIFSEDEVVVEADGRGGAKLLIVVGNYPIDYSIKAEKQFTTESGACDAAEELSS